MAATIVLTGGGSGGHITPLLAVARELKNLNSELKLVYIGQKGDNFTTIVADSLIMDGIYTVSAGKFRRYHKGFIRQFLDISTILKNVRDVFRVGRGIIDSRKILKKIKPEIIFIKGGYVGVPVGIAASRLNIPFVTHDSDAIPGLANKIIAKWAGAHAVALPKETYNYPPEKTFTVGVPVASEFQFVTEKLKNKYKQELNINLLNRILLVTGGGLGAESVNKAISNCAKNLLKAYPDLLIIIIAGQKNESKINQYLDKHILDEDSRKKIIIKSFVNDLYRYSGAADLVVTRAGATSIAEIAIQGKPCVMIPNPFLTGGHQIKNANVLKDQNAAVIVNESDLTNNLILENSVRRVLDSPQIQQELSMKIHNLAHNNSAKELAELILNIAKINS